ncbi:hypothetical protein GOBAR_DD01658 [Gossypium barbadense]|nr:hypothetical protein GOBAR_DD01658 [Gossypium barbadense]
MEGFKVLHLIAILSTLSMVSVNGQISTACTASMISSFTPCLNFITGSSGNGSSSPTQGCCGSLKSLMSTSMDCACLIITASVPFQLPINRTLALSLPRACNMGGVPVQCKASGTPLPAPGQGGELSSRVVRVGDREGKIVLGVRNAWWSIRTAWGLSHPEECPVPFLLPPTLAPAAASPLSPGASEASTPESDTPLDLAPASPPEAPSATMNPRIRPVLQPSASTPSYVSLPLVLTLLIGTTIFKFN